MLIWFLCCETVAIALAAMGFLIFKSGQDFYLWGKQPESTMLFHTTPPVIEKYYGLQLGIDSKLFKRGLELAGAQEKVEIEITIDGVTKQFTLDDFKKRLFGGYQGTFIY